MKTKRLFTALMMTAILGCGTILAQPAAPKGDKLTKEQRQEMKIKQMEKRLMLDEATAAKFAPLYKEYLEAMKQCRPAPAETPEKGKKELTDAQLDQLMKDRFAMRKKLIETQETYYNKFKGILNIRQVEALFKADTPRKPHRSGMHKCQQAKPCKQQMAKGPKTCCKK